MTLIVVDAAEFAVAAAAHIAQVINAAVEARAHCSAALCGGTTPANVYQVLATSVVPWPAVSIFFGDERAVPPDDPDSNYAMARRTLLDHVAVPFERIHRMEADAPDRDAAARAYERALPPRLDVLLLGVGADGHTASLFPHADALREARRRVVAVPPPAIVPQVSRLTITPLVIAAARQIVVMVRGAEKASIVAQVLQGAEEATLLPAQLARTGTWILDRAAASKLQSKDS